MSPAAPAPRPAERHGIERPFLSALPTQRFRHRLRAGPAGAQHSAVRRHRRCALLGAAADSGPARGGPPPGGRPALRGPLGRAARRGAPHCRCGPRRRRVGPRPPPRSGGRGDGAQAAAACAAPGRLPRGAPTTARVDLREGLRRRPRRLVPALPADPQRQRGPAMSGLYEQIKADPGISQASTPPPDASPPSPSRPKPRTGPTSSSSHNSSPNRPPPTATGD